MKNIKENIIKNKFIYIAIILVIILVIVGIVVTNKKEDKTEKYLKDLAKFFYEDHYYDAQGNEQMTSKEYVEQFKQYGFTANLDNLSRYGNVDKKKVDYLINEAKCNKENTKVIIKPVEPYGKKDYHIEVVKECE